jgi:enoyl-CoA hydratase/carnithine racemase
MMQALCRTFSLWAEDPDIKSAVIMGAGSRAFCSGGDLRTVHGALLKKDYAFLDELFRVEYSANLRLKSFPKPYVALMQGYTMGGGMGASIHGSYRVVSENATLAMPETSIGYFPDVGGSYFLNRCPGFTGLYLGLTGLHISAYDALYVGWATHYVTGSDFLGLKKALDTHSDVADVLSHFSKSPGVSTLHHQQEEIDRHFKYETLEEIFESLQNSNSPFAEGTLKILKSRSPLSLHVTFKQLKSTKNRSFDEVMASEYHLSQKFVRGHDFQEGIRAAIIHKDRQPRWQHASIYDVCVSEVEHYFSHPYNRFESKLLTLKDL